MNFYLIYFQDQSEIYQLTDSNLVVMDPDINVKYQQQQIKLSALLNFKNRNQLLHTYKDSFYHQKNLKALLSALLMFSCVELSNEFYFFSTENFS